MTTSATDDELTTVSSTDSTSTEPSDGGDRIPLTAFDMASIGVGALIIVLIAIMVVLIVLFAHRRRVLMKRQSETA